MDIVIFWASMLCLGACLGFMGGIFGIGGGIIAIPILVVFFSVDQITAQGTAAAMMLPNLAMAWWRFASRNPIGLSWTAAGAALVATVSTYVAAIGVQYVNRTDLQIIFALFLTILGISKLVKFRQPALGSPLPGRLIPLVGLAGGGCMGLLGVGGGLVAAPMLTGLYGLGQRAAQAVALALVTPSAAAGVFAYAQHQNIDWAQSAVLAGGGLLTVSRGVAVAHSLSEDALRHGFGIMLITMGLIVGLKALL